LRDLEIVNIITKYKPIIISSLKDSNIENSVSVEDVESEVFLRVRNVININTRGHSKYLKRIISQVVYENKMKFLFPMKFHRNVKFEKVNSSLEKFKSMTARKKSYYNDANLETHEIDESLKSILSEEEYCVLKMMWLGHSKVEISKELGIGESKLYKMIQKTIRPKVRKLINESEETSGTLIRDRS